MANTLAYYDTATITAVKSFIVQGPMVSNVIKLFCRNLVSTGKTTVKIMGKYVTSGVNYAQKVLQLWPQESVTDPAECKLECLSLKFLVLSKVCL